MENATALWELRLLAQVFQGADLAEDKTFDNRLGVGGSALRWVRFGRGNL